MKNNTAEKNNAPSAAEIAAVVAAFKSATREEQLVLNGVMLGMATQRSITERSCERETPDTGTPEKR